MPCLVCGRKPSDPHHLRFAQPRALGRKASDEFTVPLCRMHHREVHRADDEKAPAMAIGETRVVGQEIRARLQAGCGGPSPDCVRWASTSYLIAKAGELEH
jgi:hypothetical protein